MSIHRLENCADYWSTDPNLGLPCVNTIMPRSRFFQLLQAIHLNDNEKATKKGDSGYDPLLKLGPVTTELQRNSCRIYVPSDCHSIDERMVLLKVVLQTVYATETDKERFQRVDESRPHNRHCFPIWNVHR